MTSYNQVLQAGSTGHNASPIRNSSITNLSAMAMPLLTRRHRLAPWVCILFAFLANLTRRLIQIPLLRICELGACRAYYAKHDPSVIGGDGNVEEYLCKTKEIQNHLAYVIGVIEVLQIVIGKISATENPNDVF